MLPLGDRFHDHADRRRRRHDRGTGHLDQLLVARRLLHDMFEKQIVNLVPGRREILPFEHRTDVVGQHQRSLLAKNLLHLRLRVFIARVDQRELVGGSEPRARLRGCNVLGHLDHVGDRAAVRPAGHQNHVGPHRANTLDLFMRQPAVVRREHVDDDRARPERGPLRAFAGHVLHHPGHHHLQPAARAAGGDVDIHARLRIALRGTVGRNDLVAVENLAAGEFFDFRNRVQHAAGDIFERRFDRRRCFATIRLPIFVADLLDQNGFGRGAATVGGDDDVERMAEHRLGEVLDSAHSSSRGSLRSLGSLRSSLRFDEGDEAGDGIASFKQSGHLLHFASR